MSAKIRLALLPGLLCDGAVWQHQIDALADLADIFVPDFSGFDSITRMAESVLESVPGTLAIVGHSMGGRAALECVRLAPERVIGLGLFNTGYTPRVDAEHVKRQQLIETARLDGMEKLVARWIPPLLSDSNPNREDVLQRMRSMAQRSTPAVFENHNRTLLDRPDSTALLPTIRCPTLLISGRHDTQSPIERHEQMAAMISAGGGTARMVAIEDCGHLCMLESPQTVNQALRAWLPQL